MASLAGAACEKAGGAANRALVLKSSTDQSSNVQASNLQEWQDSQSNVLASVTSAGALVGLTLGRLHLMGIVAGVIYLLVTAIWARSAAALLRPASLLVVIMVVLTFISQYWVSGTMDALRGQMGSVAATPATNELRASFDRLHRISVNLEMAVLAAGLLALFFTSRIPRTTP